jgi:NTE family protein
MMQHIDYETLKDKEVYITISESGEESKGILQLFSSTYKHYIKKDSKVHYLPLQNLDQETCLEVVKASCSIPVVFPAVVKDNKKYYDGGLFDNMPVLPLIETGCTEIYVVVISFLKQQVNIKKKYPNVKFHILKPSKSLGKILDFGEKHSKRIYEMGYTDTIAYYKKLEK